MESVRLIFSFTISLMLLISCNANVKGGDLSVEKIVDDVYCIHQGDTNSGFFKFKGELYVVDTHFPPSLSKKQEKLIHSKYKGERIAYLINTNINIDTISGNQIFADEAKIISTSTAREKIIDHPDAILAFAQKEMKENQLKKIKLTPADITFDEELKIYDSDYTLQIIDVKDVYDEGNLVVNIKGKGVLFAGFLFWNKIVPDLKEAKIRDYQRELENITRLSPTRIVPRYGPVGNYDDFIAFKEYIDNLITETQNHVKKGATLEDVLDKVNFEKFKGWKFYSERHPVNVQRVYNELKSENNQILEFLKAIQQQKKN